MHWGVWGIWATFFVAGLVVMVTGYAAVGLWLIVGSLAWVTIAYSLWAILKHSRDMVRNIVREMEAKPVTLNSTEVSIASLFWELRDWFARGLGETNIPSLLASEFKEQDSTVWASVQRELITTLRTRKLITLEQRPTFRYGTEIHFILTELGCDVLNTLDKKLAQP